MELCLWCEYSITVGIAARSSALIVLVRRSTAVHIVDRREFVTFVTRSWSVMRRRTSALTHCTHPNNQRTAISIIVPHVWCITTLSGYKFGWFCLWLSNVGLSGPCSKESSGWMFLLVPAHPGFPRQIPQSRKTVVCVCVCVVASSHYLSCWEL